ERIDARLSRLPTFAWIPIAAAGLTPKAAKALARREGVRLSHVGKGLRVHLGDLEALAERNAITDAPVTVAASPDDATDDVDPTVKAAFDHALAKGGR
ncbi:MAG: hypothetical protein ACHREM_15440, partial [Polyangiales bacterium]